MEWRTNHTIRLKRLGGLLLCLMVIALPFTTNAQPRTPEAHNDSILFLRRPQRSHYKVYSWDWIGLALRNGKFTVGKEFMLTDDVAAEVELGVRIMSNAISITNPLFVGIPFSPRASVGPSGTIHFKWYPDNRVLRDPNRNFAGFYGGLCTDMSLVYFRKLDIYDDNDLRPYKTHEVIDADAYSLRLQPTIGYSDYWSGKAQRGFTWFYQFGYLFRFEKIQGDIRTLGLNPEPRPPFFSFFRHTPTLRFGFGYAF